MPNRIPFRRAASLGYLVNLTGRRLSQALRRELAVHGVQPAQFGALVTLWEEGPLSQTALSERLSIEQPTMANTLRRMERDGLVERRPCETDRRVQLFAPTATAQAMRAELTAAAMRVNAAGMARLTSAERETLFTLLATVVQSLEEDAASQPAHPHDHHLEDP